jgi:hypothetical protein
LQNRLVREQIKGLEDHPDVGAELRQLATLLGQDFAVDRDCARLNGFEAVDGAAQRGLARTRRAEHDDHLAAVDVEVDVLQNVEFAEMLVDVLDRDHRHCPLSRLRHLDVRPALTHGCRPYPGNEQLVCKS